MAKQTVDVCTVRSEVVEFRCPRRFGSPLRVNDRLLPRVSRDSAGFFNAPVASPWRLERVRISRALAVLKKMFFFS